MLTGDGPSLARRVWDQGGMVTELALLPSRPTRAALELLGVHPDVSTAVAKHAPALSDSEVARWAVGRADDIECRYMGTTLGRSDHMHEVVRSWRYVAVMATEGRLVAR